MYEKKRIKICFGVVVTAILVAAIFFSLRPRPEPFTDTMTILSAGCGNVGELSDAASIEESTKQKNTDAVLYVPLVAPTVKDGIIELGDWFILISGLR